MTKTKPKTRPPVESDEFEIDWFDELLESLAEPLDCELAEPEARVPKSVRSTDWCYYEPGESRHGWADDFKRPPKPSRTRK